MSKQPPSPPETPATIAEALVQASRALQMQRPEEAERLARAVLKSSRVSVTATQILAAALAMQGRAAEAIDPLRRAARRGEDPAIETLLARALAAGGRQDEAVEQLRRATARRPAFPRAFVELGELLGAAGRFADAIAVFEDGLALMPEAVVLRIGLGYMHLRRNDRDKARDQFLLARTAAPERRDAVIALARVLALDGDFAAAADLYRLALQSRPEDAERRIELGKCLLELGRRDEAEAMLRATARGDALSAGPAIKALAATPHGRFFLRPSAAASFLGVKSL